MKFQADYYDGINASAKPVLVRVAEHTNNISFDAGDENLVFNFVDLEVQAKLGATKRVIDLPNGGRLEAADITELELAMPSKQNAFWRGLHYLENHLGWILVAMLMTVFAGWLFLQFGVPTLAEYVAKATPPKMETKLGEQALEGLDSQFGYFTPSKLEAKDKASISVALAKLCVAMKNCPSYRLEFRSGGMIGANAFALPGGIMVVTDELVKLAKNNTEIIAVLAHELGHVKRRHAFRQSIQGVLSGLVLAAVTGDVSAVASGLPAALMQMRYSRLHEIEADEFALKALQKACLPPRAFADILMLLEAQARAKSAQTGPEQTGREKNNHEKNSHEQNSHEQNSHEQNSTSKSLKTKNANTPETQANREDLVTAMLSTHPDTQARIKPFLKAKQECPQVVIKH